MTDKLLSNKIDITSSVLDNILTNMSEQTTTLEMLINLVGQLVEKINILQKEIERLKYE